MTLNDTSPAAYTDHPVVDRVIPTTTRREAPSARILAERRRKRAQAVGAIVGKTGRILATSVVFVLAVLAAVLTWDYYVTTPWTRDGRVRVQVASVAPQVSGQIVKVNVTDNQFVHKGDVLYVIDPVNFQNALDQARAQLEAKTADMQVKKLQSQRRQALSDLSTSVEEKQLMAGAATQADGAFQTAQAQVQLASINLGRTEVRSPVNGYVTNLLMRVGDYAHEGVTDLSVIDTDSYWIDGYFEETKMPYVCVGDLAEAHLLGYDDLVQGRVETITRGISVSNASPSTQGLPNVDPVYTWVRLAQRVPVRIKVTHVPPGIPLVSGLTATVSIEQPHTKVSNGFLARLQQAGDLFADRWHGVHAKPSCLTGTSSSVPADADPAPQAIKGTGSSDQALRAPSSKPSLHALN
jgi:multidrug resistance efflux pump